MNSACFSLTHILFLYYDKPPTKGLEIKTDNSILIDQNVMVNVLLCVFQQLNVAQFCLSAAKTD